MCEDETADRFLQLARANVELGNAVVDLISEKKRLVGLIEQMEAELADRNAPVRRELPRATRQPFRWEEARTWALDVFNGLPIHRPAHFTAACGSLAIQTRPEGNDDAPVTVLMMPRDLPKLRRMLEVAEADGGCPEHPAGQQVRVYEDDGDVGLPGDFGAFDRDTPGR